MAKLPDSAEAVRDSVHAWIDACDVTTDSLSTADALQTYRSYLEWTYRNAWGHVTAPYFCQLIYEIFGPSVMTHKLALYQREVD